MIKRFVVVTVILLAGLSFWLFSKGTPSISNPALDQFAQCLAQKNVTMYGAYWCPHCQAQKKLFGDSFKYIRYVECTEETKACEEKGIKGYPTWIFEDGSRIEGEVTFSQLSQKTSCLTS